MEYYSNIKQKATPVEGVDLTNKKYVDEAIQANAIGKETVLYDGNIASAGTYTLADDVNNYDFIVINHTHNSTIYKQSNVLTKSEISKCIDENNKFLCVYGDGSASIYTTGYFNEDKIIVVGSVGEVITSITGYKFGQVTVQNTITNPSPGESYSTDEQLTGGTWIDGKPIYRKTFYSSSGWAQGAVIGNISDLKLVISLKTVCLANNGSYWSSPFSDTDQCNVCVRKTTGEVLVANKDTFINQEQIIVVEYTKTTD